jgi:predicted DNA binding protein
VSVDAWGVGDALEEAASTRDWSGAPARPATSRRVGRFLLDLTDEVAQIPDRDAAERAVCTGLVDSGLYRSAWVAVRSLDDEGVAVRTSATDAAEDPGTGAVATDGGVTAGAGPWVDALETGAVHVGDATDVDPDSRPVRDVSPEGSVAAIPLGRRDTVYGVLVVETRRPNAFGELERTGLDVLGTTLGLAIDAIRSHELYFADAVLEVELRITDDDSLLVRTSDELDCRVSLEGYAANGDRWHLYCDVVGSGSDAVTASIAADPAVTDCRTIVSRTDGCRVELETEDLSLLCHAVAAGATVDTAVADHGTCRVTLELPQSSDVCETVARLRDPYPELDLLSCRELDREATEPDTTVGVFESMTDRQREALEAAYRAGYFEWPRRNTAEEIAPELGITSPTLHWHLREAERRLLGTLFE